MESQSRDWGAERTILHHGVGERENAVLGQLLKNSCCGRLLERVKIYIVIEVDVRMVKATPSKWPSAERATSTGRACVPAFWPNTFLNKLAATVTLAARNSAAGTAANC